MCRACQRYGQLGDLRNIGLDGIGSLDNDPVVSVEGIVGGKEQAVLVFSELVSVDNLLQSLEILHYCCSRQ